jgi:hypothetical protein
MLIIKQIQSPATPEELCETFIINSNQKFMYEIMMNQTDAFSPLRVSQ